MRTNPFHDLYLSEAISEEALVEIFSPKIVDLAGAVFESGNVIIRGLQGTGKTMLLNLLRPESRIAYKKANVKFPLSKEHSKFIGAGVNLRKCGAIEFAQHLHEDSEDREILELELLFADFLNYWIASDILATLDKFMIAQEPALCAELGLSLEVQKLNRFSAALAAEGCWFGALNGVDNYEQLKGAIGERISTYRRFLNLNITELPKEILESKTVIGDPILKLSECLRNYGVIEEDTKVFVRIDQYEQLTTLNLSGSRFKYGDSCQQLIHKALGARDGRVSYRIGTRAYGWPARPVIYRTEDSLELKRDFSFLNIDELFRRRENARTWRFPEFAKDIFSRRLRAAEFHLRQDIRKNSLTDALSDSPRPSERAENYVSPASARDLIRREIESIEHLPDEWKHYVETLSRSDILAAWLSCAWIRQKLSKRKKSVALGEPPHGEAKPWKPYWYKERVPQALMQIASANRQALAWSGEDEILNLSGGQILVFLFLLQHIWDAWLRDNRGSASVALDFPIPQEIQSQGVFEASQEWKSKQIEGPNARQRRVFVDAVGRHLNRRLIVDKAMSYPGANGFSLRVDELEKAPKLDNFLCQAVGYGDFYEYPHTSKNAGEIRKKYYLAPILSPIFKIPSVHTKEPEYTNIAQLEKWLNGLDGSVAGQIDNSTPAQGTLFGDEAND
ncbi:MAG: hypothetical protein QHC88_02575 [Achromobacter sp.]|uniref:ORC-CDC6 family AAA ATPase n=1 Tax=Achromobacter sp. TaxID=134375 RepID=UPI0029AB65A5|nr:hypothetical protein [Achromobacter sp.]MDX3984116.1 hypothetical protein [Achromobacter sp.]